MIDVSIEELFAEFAERVRGTRVRGQVVEHVEMTIDTCVPPSAADHHSFRYFLAVQFEHRPGTDDLDVEVATSSTYSRDVFVSRLAGEGDPQWLLADEL